MEKRKEILLLTLLLIVLFVINYSWMDFVLEEFLEQKEEIFVDRVIDGDTFVSNGTSIRLLGINTPEKGEFFYLESKEFLESEILNKSVIIEFVGKKQDKYYRTLAYVFYKGENINVKLVEKGLANYYFYSGKDKYSEDLINAWQVCLDNKINLCKLSSHICADCIEINPDSIINNCAYNCNISGWEIKEEGRNKFIFSEQYLQPGKKAEFELDLSNSGGSLFLRDNKGYLIKWKN